VVDLVLLTFRLTILFLVGLIDAPSHRSGGREG